MKNTDLEVALNEAARWAELATEHERSVLRYEDARASVLDRIYQKYKE
jgi:hypothetical protein